MLHEPEPEVVGELFEFHDYEHHPEVVTDWITVSVPLPRQAVSQYRANLHRTLGFTSNFSMQVAMEQCARDLHKDWFTGMGYYYSPPIIPECALSVLLNLRVEYQFRNAQEALLFKLAFGGTQ